MFEELETAAQQKLAVSEAKKKSEAAAIAAAERKDFMDLKKEAPSRWELATPYLAVDGEKPEEGTD